MNRKATIEVQFNWLFIGIIGAIILISTFVVGGKIVKNSDESLNYDILNYLDRILIEAETNADTEHRVMIPDTKLSLDCEQYGIVESEYSGIPIATRSVFSPNLIKEEMITYTRYWEVPFKSTFFLYLTSPRIYYGIVPSSSYDSKVLLEMLPKEMNKHTIPKSNINSFNNENYDKIRFVFLDTDLNNVQLTSIKGIQDKDVTAVKFEPNSFPEGTGLIKFYQKSGDTFTFRLTGTSKYLNSTTLLAAIYSEDKEMYECNLIKAFQRMQIISDILAEKSKTLKDSSVGYTDTYDSLNSKFVKLSDYLDSELNNLNIGSNFDEMYRTMNEIENLQYDYLEAYSCPTIY